MAARTAVPERVVNVLLGQRLVVRRDSMGWSQDVLASEMTARGFRWTQTTVATIEAGTRSLTIAEVAGLCQVFQRWSTPVAWFVPMEHQPVSVPTRQEARVSARLGITVVDVQERCQLAFGRTFAEEQEVRRTGLGGDRAVYEAMVRQLREA